jgi:hypothetical protein
MKIFSVIGNFDNNDEPTSILIAENHELLPDEGDGYLDEDIYFYGLSEKDLNECVENQNDPDYHIECFKATSWELDGTT